jgi:hypothetical protein
VNRSFVALLAVVVLLALGVLAAGGAFLPFTAGPGYQPTATATPEAESTATATLASESGTTEVRSTEAQPATEASATETAVPTESRYDHATVTVLDEDGTELGVVRAAVADTREKRYTGLSDTEFLPEDRGMLFTYESEGSRTYVMRGMDFGIDIVYIGANGTITSIHHAPEPPEGEDGESYRYPGQGQYVLEVNYEWTTRHNVTEGDRVRIASL